MFAEGFWIALLYEIFHYFSKVSLNSGLFLQSLLFYFLVFLKVFVSESFLFGFL